MLIPVTWWKRAKQRREALGLSGVELATRVGVSPQRVSDWEAGRYPNPRMDTLARLAGALECRIADLLIDHDSSRTRSVTPGMEDGTSKQRPVQGGPGVPAPARRLTENPAEPSADAIDAAARLYGIALDCSELAERLLGVPDRAPAPPTPVRPRGTQSTRPANARSRRKASR